MELLWNIVFMVITLMITVLIPFAIFYYEADDHIEGCVRPLHRPSAC